MAGPLEVHVTNILSHFGHQNVSKVVLVGDAGAGKTWVARKVCESALEKALSYGSIWIVPAEKPANMDLLHIIASQLSLSSCDGEWDDDEDGEEVKDNEHMEPEVLKTTILYELEKMRTRKTQNQASKTVKETQGEAEEKKSKELRQEAAARNPKFLVVVLDGITEEQQDYVVPELEKILHPNLLKMLITRKESRDSNAGAPRESEGDIDELTDDTKRIPLEPLRSSDDVLALLQGRVNTKVKGNPNLKAVAKKISGLLPAAVILVAEALNHISLENDDLALEVAMEEVVNLKGDDILGVLRFAYDMLPDGVARSCYWLSSQLFRSRVAVHFSELITYWILEGCFDHHSRIEKAYEEGHCILMDLKGRGILKGHSNYVNMERAMLELPDERRNGFSGAAKLGLADVLSNGLGRITLADGMIRSICKGKEKRGDKEKTEISTLVIEGSRLCKGLPEEFLKSMKGLSVLAILNPMFDDLPPWLTELKDLELLVLRGCQHLKKVDEISKLTNLLVLEVSGAPSLGDINKDFFKGMANLKSVNLSGLNISTVPVSLFDRSQVRFLILRECPKFTELPSLKNMTNLEMVDLYGSTSFDRLTDGDISTLTDLKTLNVSGTKVKTLPILRKLGGLTRILLSNCLYLAMIRSMNGTANLEVLDISGSKNIKDLNSAQLQNKPHFRVLDLSGTAISSLPPHISNLSHLHLKGCSELQMLLSTKGFSNLVSLDLSGAAQLVGIGDKSFVHLKSLRRLDLSETQITQLPPLSDLVELRELLLKNCKKLTELHDLTRLEKLVVIDLSGCSSLKISPGESFNHMSRLKKLDLSSTRIETLPHDCFPSNLCHLILRDCKILKQLPSLESLSKLEELDLSKTHPDGAESLPKFKADFLSMMEKLKILNLSKTHPDGLPSLSHFKNLRELSLSGCPGVALDLEGLKDLKELQVLDLSGTEVQQLPSLHNNGKLRKLLLRNCSKLKPLMDLGSLSHLEVLDLSGTAMTCFPVEVNDLPYLTELHLQNVKQMQVDWSKIKYLPANLKLDPCEPPQISTTEITASLTTESQSPSILVRGTGLLHFLEKNLGLWNSCFREFHFSVWLCDGKGAEVMKVCGDMSVFKYHNPRGRFSDSGNCSLLEIHGSSNFPSELKKALMRAHYVSVIDNEAFKSISDLGKENVSSMDRCWLERCPNVRSIFIGEGDRDIGEQLKGLYLCNLSSLERLCTEQLQSGIFSNLTKLQIDCCPELVNIFSLSQLPRNLETLKVKFCYKLGTFFEGGESAEMPNMRTLELIDLPALRRIGVEMPRLETLKVRACKNLPHSELSRFPNLKKKDIVSCPGLENGFSSSQ